MDTYLNGKSNISLFCFEYLPKKVPTNTHTHTLFYIFMYPLVMNLHFLSLVVLAMTLASKLVLLFALFVLSFNHIEAKMKITRMQFYMHDVVGGPNPTAVRVAGRSNFTGTNPIEAMFGSIFIMDNPLTATHNPNSTVLGRAQGIYAMSSKETEFSLLMTLTYGFISGPYNGSSFSVIGRNPVMSEVREMPVVGGTGMFRLARGYCLAKTYSMDQMDAIIGYNVTLIH